jgi:beta-ribofuranosylaminobenzene 5'-phosphate synthase
MKMLPSLVEGNIEGFGEALTEIQRLVGKTFSRYQTGIFHSRASETLVKFFLEMGAHGAGQSSWGPTVYGLVKGRRKSKDLESRTKDFLEKNDMDWLVRRCVANNTGAMIKRFVR